MNTPIRIQPVTAADGVSLLDGLCALLDDAVAGGASIGFLSPLSATESHRYWVDVFDMLLANGVLLWVALEGDRVVGSVQLAPSLRANGRNRAEVQKLMVLRSHRGLGIATRLMGEVEAQARALGHGLLHLDTEASSAAEGLYQMMGYCRVGEIPDYAATPNGVLHPTAIYYKQLQTAHTRADALSEATA